METVQNINSEFINEKEIKENQNSFLGGGLGLAKTYWIFGFIGSFIIKMIMTAMIMNGASVAFIILLGLGYSIPVWIAIWNSATQYKGLKLWSILAKIAVVFGVLLNIAQFNQ